MEDAEITIAGFRGQLREFANEEAFPDEVIEPWLEIAKARFATRIWNKARGLACYLYTAHELTLSEYINTHPGAAMQLAGGALNSESKSVGSLSLSTSRDSSGSSLDQQGYFSLTIYGMRLFKMFRIYGARVLTV